MCIKDRTQEWQNAHEVKVEINRMNAGDIYMWLFENFGVQGKRWETTFATFSQPESFLFLRDRDATLFCLRWSKYVCRSQPESN
ncbi:MAG: hypothetical protein LC650_02220 [Actinobacteria bacterium]|nr:hypothetical protein [Actinomycetota bacterium]